MAAYYHQGKYRTKITAQVLAENNKGNPELQLTHRPMGYYDEKGNFEENVFDFDRTIFLTLTEGTIGTEKEPGWVLKVLLFLGFQGTSFGQLDPDAENAWNVVGIELDVYCNHEEYQGKTREKWAIAMAQGQRDYKPLEKKSVRELDAKFGKVLKNGAKAPMPANAPPKPAPASVTGEDIPF